MHPSGQKPIRQCLQLIWLHVSGLWYKTSVYSKLTENVLVVYMDCKPPSLQNDKYLLSSLLFVLDLSPFWGCSALFPLQEYTVLHRLCQINAKYLLLFNRKFAILSQITKIHKLHILYFNVIFCNIFCNFFERDSNIGHVTMYYFIFIL